MSFGSPTVTLTLSLVGLQDGQGLTYEQLRVLLTERGVHRTVKTIGAVMRGEQSGSPKLVAALADILTTSDKFRAITGHYPMVNERTAA